MAGVPRRRRLVGSGARPVVALPSRRHAPSLPRRAESTARRRPTTAGALPRRRPIVTAAHFVVSPSARRHTPSSPRRRSTAAATRPIAALSGRAPFPVAAPSGRASAPSLPRRRGGTPCRCPVGSSAFPSRRHGGTAHRRLVGSGAFPVAASSWRAGASSQRQPFSSPLAMPGRPSVSPPFAGAAALCSWLAPPSPIATAVLRRRLRHRRSSSRAPGAASRGSCGAFRDVSRETFVPCAWAQKNAGAGPTFSWVLGAYLASRGYSASGSGSSSGASSRYFSSISSSPYSEASLREPMKLGAAPMNTGSSSNTGSSPSMA